MEINHIHLKLNEDSIDQQKNSDKFIDPVLGKFTNRSGHFSIISLNYNSNKNINANKPIKKQKD